jgi:hypothetical protein
VGREIESKNAMQKDEEGRKRRKWIGKFKLEKEIKCGEREIR